MDMGYDGAITEASVLKRITEIVGSYLHLPEAEINLNLPFLDLGADSIIIVEIMREINKAFSTQIEASDFYDYHSITKISRFVYDEIGKAKEAMNQFAASSQNLKPNNDGISLQSKPFINNEQDMDTNPPVTAKKPKEPAISLKPVISIPQNIDTGNNGRIVGGANLKQKLAIIFQKAGFNVPADLPENLKLSQLGVDFIAKIEIVKQINEEFGLNMDDEDIGLDGTMGQLLEWVHSKTATLQRKLSNITSGNHDPGNARNNENETFQAKPPAGKIKLKGLPEATMVFSSPADMERIADGEDKNKPPQSNENFDIAVVGMSGRFPGAHNIDEFWRNLVDGTASIGTLPASRWSGNPDYDNEATDENRWFGSIDNVDKFDPLFFNISPKEAELMDPQQRLFLEEAWNALEHAGYSMQELSGMKCGVFTGVTQGDYSQLVRDHHQELTAQFMLGSSTAILPARISYFLNLTGPCIAVDTACSSSLVAVHLACRSIRSHECEMALAGGVYIQTTPNMHQMTANAGMLSNTGKCHSFDNSADGFVLGEGVGVVVLKALDRAIADKNIIYGVIKGSGINQDGATNGITAPSAASQTKLEMEVYQQYHIHPETITFIETHGTGTKLGDPIEIKALTNSYAQWTNRKHFCAIGSVKTNIGHLLSAAGIAGLIKVLLCLKYRKLVPSLHYQQANENIQFTNTPFFLSTELHDWMQSDNTPRRAAISAFGFSGTNCHMVIEEAPVQYQPGHENCPNPCFLIILSAKTRNALYQKFAMLAEWIETEGFGYSLPDIAYTLQVGRSHLPVRASFLVKSLDEMRTIIRDFLTGLSPADLFINDVSEGMLQDEPILKELTKFLTREIQSLNPADVMEYKEKLLALAQLYGKGYDIDWKILYAGNDVYRIPLPLYPFEWDSYWVRSDSQDNVPMDSVRSIAPHPMIHSNRSTLYEQIFYTYLSGDEYYVHDHIVGGHRVLPAVAYLEIMQAAGTLSLGNRSIEMEDIIWENPVIIDDEVTLFTSLVPDGNHINCQIGIRTKNDARLVCCSGRISLQSDNRFPSAPVTRELEEIRKRCSSRLSAPECYEHFRDLGVEFGHRMKAIQELIYNKTEVLAALHLPAKLRSNFSAYTLPPSLLDGAVTSAIALMGDDETVIRVPYALEKIEVYGTLEQSCYAYIKVAGESNSLLSIEIMAEDGRVLVRLGGLLSKAFPLAVKTLPAVTRLEQLDTVYLREVWEESIFPGTLTGNRMENFLLFDQDELLFHELLSGRNTDARRVILVKPGRKYSRVTHNIYELNPNDEQSYELLLSRFRFEGGIPENIIHRWACNSGSNWRNSGNLSLERNIYPLFYLLRSLLRTAELPKTNVLYTYPTNDEYGVMFHEAVAGLAKTVNQENTLLLCKTIGFDPSKISISRQSDLIASVLTSDPSKVSFQYENGKLATKIIKRFDMENEVSPQHGGIFKDSGVYLITGGAGGLGRLFTKAIIQQNKVVIILTGRSPLNQNLLPEFESMNRNGSEIVYLSCDVSQYEQVTALIKTIKNRYGRINGIIHAAGITRDALIAGSKKDEWDEVLAPKVYGTINLDMATRDETLDFYILFSSIAAIIGNYGQATYTYANYFQNELAAWREQLRQVGKRCGKTIAIGWPEWEKGGLRVSETVRNYFKEKVGSKPIDFQTGWNRFLLSLDFEGSCFSLAQADPTKVDSLLMANKRTGNSGQAKAEIPPIPASGSDHGKIENKIRSMIANQIKIVPEKLNVKTELSKYGFDSIMLTDLVSVINRELKVELTPAIFFEYPTIASLSDYLARTQLKGLVTEINQNVSDTNPKYTGLTSNSDSRTPEPKFKITAALNKELIAIIGMYGILPGSADLDEFWENIENGRSLISEIPAERWNWKDYYGDPTKEANKTNVIWGGFIKEPFAFDAKFFEISPREAEWMDPQQRIFLETVWKTIEDAGYGVSSLGGKRVGLFVGVSTNDYLNYIQDHMPEIEPYGMTGNAHSIIPNRVSHILNLRGPSKAIDTACSGALVAIKQAMESVRNNECDMAIAGGVNILLSPDGFIGFSKAGMLSKTGCCKTFDANADGYARGEGAGAVLLKPLHQARKDGDHIYAVIRGAAENHVGKSTSLTAPNATAQAEVIISAVKDAGIPPETITYIEAHGTGTKLGDPTEINGLKKAFAELMADKPNINQPFCGLSSVKTNIGHLEPASGIAGIIKVILAMRQKKIPMSINLEKLNPYINLEDTPFYIITETQNWERKEIGHRVIARRAGISAFGFGGSNAHIILEEYDEAETQFPKSNDEQIIVLSAKDDERLRAYAGSLLQFLKKHKAVNKVITMSPDSLAINQMGPGDICLENIAYTLQVGRDAMPVRIALIISSIPELLEKLEAFLTRETSAEGVFYDNYTDNITGNVNTNEAVKEALLLKDRKQLARLWTAGYDLDWNQLYSGVYPRRISLPSYPFSRTCYRVSIPQKDIRKFGGVSYLHPLVHRNLSTLNQQKFVTSLSGEEFFLQDHVIDGKRVLPGVAYIELARAIGGFSCKSPIRKISNLVWATPLVFKEGTLNFSSHIIPKGNVLHFEVSTSQDDGKNITIHAKGEMSEQTGEILRGNSPIDIEKISQQLTDRIEGNELYDKLAEYGLVYGKSFRLIKKIHRNDHEVLSYLEFPESVTHTLEDFYLHPAVMDSALQTVIGLLSNLKVRSDVMYLPFSLGELEIIAPVKSARYVHATLSESNGNSDVNYSEAGYDITIFDKVGTPLAVMRNFTVRPIQRLVITHSQTNSLQYYQVDWQEDPLNVSEFETNTDAVVLAFDNGLNLNEFLKEKGVFNKTVAIQVNQGREFKKISDGIYEINPMAEMDYQHLLESLRMEGTVPTHVAHCWQTSETGNLEEWAQMDYKLSFLSITFLAKAWAICCKNETLRLLHVYQTKADCTDSMELYKSALHRALEGFANSVQMEIPNIKVVTLCLDGNANGNDTIFKELTSKQFGVNAGVYYSGQKRFIKRIDIIPTQIKTTGDPMNIKENGVYVLAGGAGGIGLIIGRYLTRQAKLKLILIGRSELSEDRKKAIRSLEDSGSEVSYIQADISVLDEVVRIKETVKNKYGKINGIIHTAGTTNDSLLVNKQERDIQATVASKIFGTLFFDRVFAREELDFFILFSSTVALTGNYGQTDYAYANDFLGHFVRSRELLRSSNERSGKSFCYYWPLWKDGGMHVDEKTEQWAKEVVGVVPLATEKGIRAFEYGLTLPLNNIVVIDGDQSRFEKWLPGQTAERQSRNFTTHTQKAGTRDSNPKLQKRFEELRSAIKNVLANVLKIKPEEIAGNIGLEELGVNSMFIIDINQEFERNNIRVPVTKVFDLKTIDNIAWYAVENEPQVNQEGNDKQEENYDTRVSGLQVFNPIESKDQQEYRFHKQFDIAGGTDVDTVENNAAMSIYKTLPIPKRIQDFVKILAENEPHGSNNILKQWPILFDNTTPKMINAVLKIKSGKKVEVVICGTGKPLVIIGGVATLAPIWYYQLRDWSREHQVIVIHKPGHGNSELVEDLSFKGLSLWVKDIIETLGIEYPLPFIGFSVGGMMAQSVAAYYPELVSHLILIDTTYKFPNFTTTLEKVIIEDFEAVYGANSNIGKRKMLSFIFDLVRLSTGMAVDDFLNYVQRISKNDSTKDLLPLIKAPTYVIAGEKDKYFDTEIAEDISRMIPNTKLWVVPNAGHFPPLTSYRELNKKVIEFIHNEQSSYDFR